MSPTPDKLHWHFERFDAGPPPQPKKGKLKCPECCGEITSKHAYRGEYEYIDIKSDMPRSMRPSIKAVPAVSAAPPPTRIKNTVIFNEIRKAIKFHKTGVMTTTVIYDVKNECVYTIISLASTRKLTTSKIDHHQYTIFSLPSSVGAYQICKMLKYNLQLSQYERKDEYQKDNDKFNRKCMESAVDALHADDHSDVTRKILKKIQKARQAYKQHTKNMQEEYRMSTLGAGFIQYIGDGIKGVITTNQIKNRIGTLFGFSLTKNGKWKIDYAEIPLSESDIVIDLEHDVDVSDYDYISSQFSADNTISNVIHDILDEYKAIKKDKDTAN